MSGGNHVSGKRTKQPSIVIGVTSDLSIVLLKGLPAHLQSLGWAVHVVSAPGPRLDALKGAGVQVHPLPMDRNPNVLADVVSLARWVVLLLRIRPDVVSVGTPKAGLLGMLAGWITRTPFRVYMLRGLRLETTTGRQRAFLHRLEQIACRASHVVLAVSYTLRQAAVEAGLAGSDKIRVVGHGSSNGVEIRPQPPARSGASLSTHVVGFVGRATADKGIALLAESLAVLAQEGVTGQLLIIGEPDASSDAQAWTNLHESGWQVRATGMVPDVSPYYPMMDVLALPTRREGFPNVVLEAAVCQVPCVATMATGIPDAIEHGHTGIIVHDRDARKYAEGLRALLLDDDGRRLMGYQARERAQGRFERTAVWAAYADVYAGGLAAVRQTSRTSPPDTTAGHGASKSPR